MQTRTMQVALTRRCTRSLSRAFQLAHSVLQHYDHTADAVRVPGTVFHETVRNVAGTRFIESPAEIEWAVKALTNLLQVPCLNFLF